MFKNLIMRLKSVGALVFALFFGLLNATSVFAQSTGADKLKEAGNKLLSTGYQWILILVGIVFVGLLIAGFVLIFLSSVRQEFRKRGISFIIWSVIGLAGISLVWVIAPIILEGINGLGGEKIDAPTKDGSN
jgi:Na+-driven multidrug efflux pump